VGTILDKDALKFADSNKFGGQLTKAKKLG
jgi:hypothetical protein